MPLPIVVRDEQPADISPIRDVNVRAFQREQEANIVDALRANRAVRLSLVATVDNRVVAHLLLSPISVGETSGAALAPMAVLPEYQRQGIGAALIAAGVQRLNAAGDPFVIVLGHARYYSRFGFVPASTHGIRCEWAVPDEAFMVLVLDASKMRGVCGLAKYRDEFSMVM